MTRSHENPYAALKRVYHEPSRMAIMTALCGAEDGLSFGELKRACALTDGNLNRHLKALTEEAAVHTHKVRDGAKTITIVAITDTGREHFVDYLHALEDILRKTADMLAVEERADAATVYWPSAATAR